MFKREFLSPFQGLNAYSFTTQGGARFTSLALGYHLSGFQPFIFEPHVVYFPVVSRLLENPGPPAAT